MTYAVFTDVATRLGRTISDALEIAQINAWISDAESLMRERIPGIDASVVLNTPTLDTVKSVIANVVVRKANNPEGKKDERIDDYSYGLHADAARPDIHFTDDEWARLMPAAAGKEGAFTAVSTGTILAKSGQWITPDGWLPA